MDAVAIAGFGLVSAQGLSLEAACTVIKAGGKPAQMHSLSADISRPYFAIEDDHPDWTSRAENYVRQAILAAGANDDRDGALFIATSSRDAGFFENSRCPDEQKAFSGKPGAFVQQVKAWLDWRGPVYCVSNACTSS